MAAFEQLYVATTFVTSAMSVSLGVYVFRIDEPVFDVRGLITYLVSSGIAAMFFGLLILAEGRRTMLLLLNLNWTFVVPALLGFVHFSLALNGRLDSLARSRRLGSVALGVGLVGLVWTDRFHGRFRESVVVFETPLETVDVVYGSGGFVFVAALAMLTGIGSCLVMRHFYRSNRSYRTQGLLVVVAILLPWVGVTLTLIDVPDPAINMTPQSAAISAVLLTFAISQYGLLNFVPLAHAEIVEHIDDYVFVAGPGDTVVSTNQRALELIDGDPVGVPLESALPIEDELPAADTPCEREVTVDRGGRRMVLSLRSRPLTANDGRFVGRTVTLREVTELKAREQELDLLKQVLTRVLRHNIRNSLVVIQSRAELIARQGDSDTTAHALDILESAENLASTSEKARTIERVLDQGSRVVRWDVSHVVARLVEEYRVEHPNASWSVEIPPTATVMAHPLLELAIENVLENAVEHTHRANPTIDVQVADENPIEVRISDDGPGIPAHERAIIDRREETPLVHGRGAGLWLVTWIVEKSSGSVSIDVDETGTTVVLEVPSASDERSPASDQA